MHLKRPRNRGKELLQTRRVLAEGIRQSQASITELEEARQQLQETCNSWEEHYELERQVAEKATSEAMYWEERYLDCDKIRRRYEAEAQELSQERSATQAGVKVAMELASRAVDIGTALAARSGQTTQQVEGLHDEVVQAAHTLGEALAQAEADQAMQQQQAEAAQQHAAGQSSHPCPWVIPESGHPEDLPSCWRGGGSRRGSLLSVESGRDSFESFASFGTAVSGSSPSLSFQIGSPIDEPLDGKSHQGKNHVQRNSDFASILPAPQ